jgi:hypothetical protein
MSGFDNGTLQGGNFAQAKQFGSILRGFGPPVPEAGVVGDLYLDIQTFNLYHKRSTDETDPWGHFLFVVPVTYQAQLKWFSAYPPTNDIGINGDYALLWGGFPNYGLQPSIFGPKAAGAWPANPAAVAVTVNPLYTAEDSHEAAGGGAITTLGAGQSPYAAQPTDGTLLITAVPFTVTVDWSARTTPLRIVDQSGAASPANPITITPKAGQTQLALLNFSYLIDGPGGSIILTPLLNGSGAY